MYEVHLCADVIVLLTSRSAIDEWYYERAHVLVGCRAEFDAEYRLELPLSLRAPAIVVYKSYGP